METADLPRATASPSWRRLRPTIISCAASLARNCSPLIFSRKAQFDSPEPGERGSRIAIFPFHFGSNKLSHELISSGLTSVELYQMVSVM